MAVQVFPRKQAALLFLAPWFLMAQGCSSSSGRGLADMGPMGETEPEAKIEFDPASTLTLKPDEAAVLTVEVTPPGVYSVRFALLSSDLSNPSDAVLDVDEVETDGSGVGQVNLTASSGPTDFTVRAATDNLLTELPVSVTATGSVRLRVLPVYSGTRPIETWTATIRTGITCDEISTSDGDLELYAESEFPAQIVVEQVPVGTTLAVIARAGHYIEGCTTLNEVIEGENNRVLVPITDRPIQLADTELDLSLSFEMVSPEWDDAMIQVTEDSKVAMLNGAGDDFDALLDAMQEGLNATQLAQFEERRLTYAWDIALETAFGLANEDLLRRTAARWMQDGQVALYEPNAISARIVPDTSDPAEARFILNGVAGYEPTEVGLAVVSEASWSADSNDSVLIGSSLAWSPSELLGGLALAPALVDHPSASTTAAALALEFDCVAVKNILLASSPAGVYDAGTGYNACVSSCTTKLCRTGVERMWERARLSTSDDMPSTLDLSASGEAEVGDGAEVVELQGAWVGRMSTSEAATAGGPLDGTE